MRLLKLYLLPIIGILFMASASCQVADTNAISNEQFREIAAGRNVVILDVRTADEFNEGHIPTAKNIDVLESDAFKKAIAALPKDKTYLLYCRSGKRSATALNIMKDSGFADVKHLQKGITGWDGETVK